MVVDGSGHLLISAGIYKKFRQMILDDLNNSV